MSTAPASWLAKVTGQMDPKGNREEIVWGQMTNDSSSPSLMAQSPAISRPEWIDRKGSSFSASTLSSLDNDDFSPSGHDDSDTETVNDNVDGSYTNGSTTGSTPRANANGNTKHDSEQAYAELSRRADLILENAKKRLERMDQNLKGARALSADNNLYRSASLMDKAAWADRPTSLTIENRNADRTRYASNNTQRSHLRVHSNIESAGSMATIHSQSQLDSKAASSAATTTGTGSSSGASAAWTAHSLRGTRSHEQLSTPSAGRYKSRNTRTESPLQSLLEVDTSATPLKQTDRPSPLSHDLHQQMHDLKDRMLQLRKRAQNDSKLRQIQHSRSGSSLSMRGRGTLNTLPEDGSSAQSHLSPATTEGSTGWSTPPAQMQGSPSADSDTVFAAQTSRTVATTAHMRQTSQGTVVVSPGRFDVASVRGSMVKSEDGLSTASSSPGKQDVESTQVPNELRHDAFDYRHYYMNGNLRNERPTSMSTDISDATAVAPSRQAHAPSPSRMYSVESLASTTSFMTATEGLGSRQPSPQRPATLAVHGTGLKSAWSDSSRPTTAGSARSAIAEVVDYEQRALDGDDTEMIRKHLESLRHVCTALQMHEHGSNICVMIRQSLKTATDILDGVQMPVSRHSA